jgi:ribosomal protein S18 acetylase RimI-like enzyme
MTRDLAAAELPAGAGAGFVTLAPWREQWFDDAARVMLASYKDHIDGRINDQYRDLPGARKFLLNVIQYPGCGRFFVSGSWIAFRRDTGAPCGLVLSSIVGPRTGHVTQICVTPEARGYGAGYELLRHALIELQRYGCTRASLTVTSSNVPAIRLYERMGFRTDREFAAHVWEGWR